MKPFYVLMLFFISALCFSETITIDPTSTTKADDENSMANIYRPCMGVPKDMKKEFELYQVSAELGNTDAQVDLGDMYSSGGERSQSYEKDNY